jgi:putative peptide zinc metalloprotease protein
MNVRIRADLIVTDRLKGLQRVWVVKDPVTFSHFLFSESEWFLAGLLDGKRTLEQVLDDWRGRFQSKSLSLEQVNQFIQRLLMDQLVVVEKTGYGRVCSDRSKTLDSLERTTWLKNPLAIRFRGVNPTQLLKELDGVARLLFHPAMITAVLVAALSVFLLLLGNFESIGERIPTINQLASTQGLIGLIVTIAFVKIVHELGHALACRRFGGECFEIGVMLLAMIPTLYTNVTDAWTIRERWKRMVVSFGGIYFEICLGAIAAVLWFMTPVGLLNALLFNVVLLCTVNTILINGNPLLRYDGYFLLSDWLEYPNLASASRQELNRLVVGCFRKPNPRQRLSGWLLVYGVASLCYRWFVVLAIMSVVLTVAFKLDSIEMGVLVCCVLLMGMLSQFIKPILSRIKRWRKMDSVRDGGEGNNGAFSLIRTAISCSLISLLIGFGVLIPLPRSVICEVEVRMESAPVFAPHDGRLIRLVSAFETVQKGDSIVRIENAELEQSVLQSRLKLSRLRQQLESMRLRINESPEVVSSVALLEKKIESAEVEVEKLRQQQSSLEIEAPQSGVVVPAMVGTERGGVQTGFHETRNQLCFVRRSDSILRIADTIDPEVNLLIPENQIGLVEVGQVVNLRFDRDGDTILTGRIKDIVSNSHEGVEAGQYLALVDVEALPKSVCLGAQGNARISVASQTVFGRARTLLQTALNTRL